MHSLLYIVAVVLIIAWSLAVFVYGYTGLIHLLLVVAAGLIILGFVTKARAA